MTELLTEIAYGLEDLGVWGYPLAVFLMTAVAILPIPAEIPAMLNGMIFGRWAGTAITWAGGLLGAWISFELAHRYGRPLARRLIRESVLERVDSGVVAAAWPGLLVVRLVPVIAFTAINWGAGLTACRRRTFLWTTAVGILPGAFVFVSSGEGLLWLYGRYPVAALGLILLIVLAVVLAIRRRRGSAGAG